MVRQGRLKPRLSISSAMMTMKTKKVNQNILFGIATPQIPIWADDDSPSHPKKQKAIPSQKLREWPDRQPPLHVSSSSHRRSTVGDNNNRRTNVPIRNLSNDNPPDDGDDSDDGNGDSGQPSPRGNRNTRHRMSDASSSRHSRGRQETPPEL